MGKEDGEKEHLGLREEETKNAIKTSPPPYVFPHIKRAEEKSIYLSPPPKEKQDAGDLWLDTFVIVSAKVERVGGGRDFFALSVYGSGGGAFCVDIAL